MLYRRKAVVRLLLENGAALESEDTLGRTPLSTAIGNGDKAVVQLLLKKYAKLEAKDKYGQTTAGGALFMFMLRG